MDPETLEKLLEVYRELKLPGTIVIAGLGLYFVWPKVAEGLATLVWSLRRKE